MSVVIMKISFYSWLWIKYICYLQVSKKKAAELMLDQLRQVGAMVVSIQFYFFTFFLTFWILEHVWDDIDGDELGSKWLQKMLLVSV